MKVNAKVYALLCCLSFMFCSTSLSAAGNKHPHLSFAQSKSDSSNSQLKIKSAKQAANLAKNKYSAKVLSIKTMQSKNGKAYRVKLLSSKGVMFFASVDARTGKVSKG